MTKRLIDYFRDINRGAQRIFTTTALLGVTVASVVLVYAWLSSRPPAPDEPAPEVETIQEQEISGLCGWAGEEVARDELNRLAGEFIPFLICGEDGRAAVTEDRKALLWDAAIKVLGHHIPTWRQETGDCVSMGVANACAYLLVNQIADGERQGYKTPFPPYFYGASRVFVGKGKIPCRSAGSLGSWGALAAKEWGTLDANYPGVPRYSGALANEWGCKGPPEKFIALAKANLVESVANVRTWQEARDAIINGYPVTVASNVGFQMRGVVRNGKLWLTPAGSWAHQMCAIGYDTAPEPCFCILNSWGPGAHGAPPDGAPPGSFWVTAKTLGRMVGQGDSFALSGQGGFKLRREIIMDRHAAGGLHDDQRRALFNRALVGAADAQIAF